MNVPRMNQSISNDWQRFDRKEAISTQKVGIERNVIRCYGSSREAMYRADVLDGMYQSHNHTTQTDATYLTTITCSITFSSSEYSGTTSIVCNALDQQSDHGLVPDAREYRLAIPQVSIRQREWPIVQVSRCLIRVPRR